MRLELGGMVVCADGDFGELADVVIDPVSRRVTHIVVEQHATDRRRRLVPIARSRAAGAAIALDCTRAEAEAFEAVRESAYLRAGQVPVADPDWDVGVQDMLVLPGYRDLDGFGAVTEPDPHVMLSYDRIPVGEVEIRRNSAVMSADGHHLGHVEGFLIGDAGTTDVVLERGHLWGRREIVIPVAAVARVENDSVTLSLTRDAVGELPARRVHRRS